MTELSPTAGKYSQDVQGDEKLSPGKAPSLCSTRYGIAFITRLCNFIIMAQNIIMNITMVTMANSTNHQSQFNSSTEGLPVDSFDDPNNSPKSLPAFDPNKSPKSIYQVAVQSPTAYSLFAGMMLGSCIAIFLGGIISQALGWPFVFYIFGGVGCVSCLLWFVLIYDDPVTHPWINITEKEYIISSLAQQVSSSKQPLPIKAMVRSLPLWSLCFCCFSHQWLINIMVVYTPTYISSVFNVDIRDSGFLSALPFIFAWVVGILGGYLADFLLTKNFRLVTVRKIATVLGCLPSSASLVVLPYVASSYITAVSLLTLSCGLSLFSQPGIYINALDIAPRHSSFLMGASRGAQVSAILAPTVSGFLLSQDPEFGWRNVFSLSFAINTLGLILYLIFGKADVQDWAKERKLTRL
ncbi:sodium-dependent phosphate transport protein 4 [Globicephala melas]|uniref:sodium-dependent phosphate transport protein 4 n=1 Tax=Globicephala melas TaxID=9731 RepID=UPI00293D9D46|nr:sodium-dependent phosphate transport protein 4-like [Globicephala melas]